MFYMCSLFAYFWHILSKYKKTHFTFNSNDVAN